MCVFACASDQNHTTYLARVRRGVCVAPFDPSSDELNESAPVFRHHEPLGAEQARVVEFGFDLRFLHPLWYIPDRGAEGFVGVGHGCRGRPAAVDRHGVRWEQQVGFDLPAHAPHERRFGFDFIQLIYKETGAALRRSKLPLTSFARLLGAVSCAVLPVKRVSG